MIHMVMRAFLLDVANYTPITKDFLFPLDKHSTTPTSGFHIGWNLYIRFVHHSKRERETAMGTNDYERFNHTLQECRDGLMKDIESFGTRYTLLKKALELLDNQETQELVREWFDIYMQVIDETSYLELSGKMDELETTILREWFKGANKNK